MNTLVAAGSHLCREVHDKKVRPKQTYLNPDDILIHHYRKNCKSVHGDDKRCNNGSNFLVNDVSLSRFHHQLIPKVQIVLKHIKQVYR